ncbi:MAG: redox-sensing transcriptional repressor Rex [Christensenellales bacterium]
MMKKGRVSEAVVRRIPKYYRYLKFLEKNGIERISSLELSRKMGFNASQIRQDFNCFGGFGQQGYGYHVPSLRRELGSILGLDQKYRMAVVGVGNIGQALAGYANFIKEGFIVAALFDANPKIIGSVINGCEVMDIKRLEEVVSSLNIHIGVIATPAVSAADVASRLSKCGVKAIWNFAPIDVGGDDAIVENVHLSDGLYVLSYRMNADKQE